MSGYELRTIDSDEVEAFLHAFLEAFHEEPREEHLALWQRAIEPERTLVVQAGDAIVATTSLFSFPALAVPGAQVPLAGVSAVGVHPVHRRRGLLDRMMRNMLDAVHERGAEAVAGLWASEAGIYGRYGFGMASRTWEIVVRSPEARLLVPAPDTRPRPGAPAELLDDIKAIHAAHQRERLGLLARDDLHWEFEIADFEHDREGAGRLRALVSDGPDGPAGYALYAVRGKWEDQHPADEVKLNELVARTPEAAVALWDHLLNLSLTRRIHWEMGPLDEELPHRLTDPRAVGGTLRDALFVRLVDAPRALAERRYSLPVDVVLEVKDEACPWNAGRWRLAGDATGAQCERTSAVADLTLGVTELGAAYLGGTTLAALAAAGRVAEHTPGALAAASQAFKGVREPWTPDQF
jgi:predicted acetyltransferase